MGMALTCSISTLMILTPTIRPKSTWPPLVMDKSGSIPTCTPVVKFVCLFSVLGEVVPWKTGTLKSPLSSKFSSPFNPSSCLKKSTSTSRASNINRVHLKVKRKIKPMQTLSDMEMLSLPWLKTSKTHPKDSNTSSGVISTLKKTKFSKKPENGSNTHKNVKHHTQALSATTITTGATPSKNQKLNTETWWKKQFNNLKNNWTNCQNHQAKTWRVHQAQKNKRKSKWRFSNQRMKTLKKSMWLTTRQSKEIWNNWISTMRKSKTDGAGTLAPWVSRPWANNLKQAFSYSALEPQVSKLPKISS